MIADTQLRDVGADCNHYPCDLVTKYRRRWNEIMSSEQQVGVTQPRRSHVDEDFAPDRRGDVHVLEIEAATECVEYKRLQWVASVDPGRSPAAGRGAGAVTCRKGW